MAHSLGMSSGPQPGATQGRQSDRNPWGADVGRPVHWLYQDIQRHDGYQSVCEKSVVICITSVLSACSKYSRFATTTTKKEHGQRQLATGYHKSILIRRPPLHFISSVSRLHAPPPPT